MDARIAKMWYERLPNYKKAKHALKALTSKEGEIGHCCLGVLCELYLEENPNAGEWISNAASEFRFTSTKEDRGGMLPNAVREWAGMETDSGKFGDGPDESLVSLNDGYYSKNGDKIVELSFEEIAKVIEENYEKL